MKSSSSSRTKVVIRHLPPSISQSAVMEQIDARFAGRYKWFSFRPGKNSQKNLRYSRAYIDFQSPEDVVEFAEFFDGHVFVNEKGSQFKALVEYAPSQRVPKLSSKRDGREGAISKDDDYLKFLEMIAKPAEHLPSAEIQMDRREAERAGGPKDSIIVTPLMEFIRKKRDAKRGSQRSSSILGRAGGAASSSSNSSKRGPEKRKGTTSVYVLRDNTKTSSSEKDKATYILSRKDEPSSRTEVLEEGTGCSNGIMPTASGSVDMGRRVVLLRGKEMEASQVSCVSSQQHNARASVRNLSSSASSKQNSRHEVKGRIIRTILSSKDIHQSQSNLAGVQTDQLTQEVNFEKDKRPPRPPNPRLIVKNHNTSTAAHSYSDGKKSQADKPARNNLHILAPIDDKNEKCLRNKDRPDRGVWTPRRSEGTQQLSDSLEGVSISRQTVGHKAGGDDGSSQSARGRYVSNSSAEYDAPSSLGENKPDLLSSNRSAESRGGRANISPTENGAHKYVARRGSAHGMKELDGSLNFSEGKTSKRGVSAGYGSHERQVWVQKSGPNS